MSDEYILIVDDDSDIRNLLGIYLENEGYSFIKCDNALKALDVLDKLKVVLILRDVMTSHGFKAITTEWWHFTLQNEPYPNTYFNFPVSSDSVGR